MATSQNGWQAVTSGSDPRLASFPWVTGKVLAGPVFTVLEHVARRFDAEVEGITVSTSWGWAYRVISGNDDLSNHASGTAIDLNAPRHPLGASGTFTAGQVASIRSILAATSPAVRWGGDYSGRKDEMHFEINTDAATVAAVAARLTGGLPPVTPPVQEALMAGPIRIQNRGAVSFVNIDNGAWVHVPNPEYDETLGRAVQVPKLVLGDRDTDVIKEFCTRVRAQLKGA
ncbi:M15 family metallopeptidase [Sanguibacter inulinus]|uniref:M15 family metallopeptidase n=1 Tax=Sanguibacter inulinus TaxID=60922 RepID=A0A853EWB9_9MICO|nr:M15 family metallopeptidase [Sanguibacter inulinus]MBF0722959.1 M15 family metallopeptidase [Sanguibacter inulinus]NYS94104.1 M15 family metallopeptidase [Sanguibacter inulinus]